MFTRIHPKNVHEMSSKKCPRKVTQKEDISWTFLSTKCRQKCPRDVTPFVHEMSPIMSTRCLPPLIQIVNKIRNQTETQTPIQNSNYYWYSSKMSQKHFAFADKKSLVNAKSRTPLGKHSDLICTESATETTPSSLQFIQQINPSAQHI